MGLRQRRDRLLEILPHGADVRVRLERGLYGSSETVHAEVTLAVDRPLKIAEGCLALVCLNEFEYTPSDLYAEGTRRGSQRHEYDRRFLLERREVLAAGTLRDWQVDLRMPAFPAPTATGAITTVRWFAEARFSVRRRADPVGTATFRVPSNRERYSDRSRRPPVSAASGCDLEVALPGGRDLEPGALVPGTLAVTARSNLRTPGIRVQLVREEHVAREAGNSKHDVADEVELAGATELIAGQRQEFSFELRLPHNAPPIIAFADNTLEWRVRGIVARRLRSDDSVAVDLNVYGEHEEGRRRRGFSVLLERPGNR
jgi:hypothetical protein